MDERDRFRARWWLMVTVFVCALLGLTPLAQALEYVRAPAFVLLALCSQGAMALLWLALAGSLVTRLTRQPSEPRALLLLMVGTAAVTFVASVLLLAFARPASPYPWFTSLVLVWLGWLPTQLITTGLIALVGSWTDATVQRQRSADRQAMLNAAVVKAELDALRARLEPHFLLNALNTVAALARTGEGDKAADVAADLGELLRFALAEATDEIPFDAEREIVERYLAIEQARMGDRLRITWDIDPAARHASLPALVWQPLVENAIRHGLAKRAAPGTLRLSAQGAHGTLTLTVDADGADREDAVPDVPAFGGLGIGIAATRRRLALLYGSAASLTLEARADGSRTTLTVPYRLPEPASA